MKESAIPAVLRLAHHNNLSITSGGLSNVKSILRTNLNHNNCTWQQELAGGFSKTKELCEYLNIPQSYNDRILFSSEFPLRIPREFVERIEKGNFNDPLLKQILPIKNEKKISPGFVHDPVGDVNAMATPGLIHKYQDRVLLITTGSCAINCRYCFRRNFPYLDFQLSSTKLTQAIKYIQNNKKITEVILSGGDPLILNDQKLFSLINRITKIKSIKRIRIHTRIPVILPNRITTEFCYNLSAINKPVVMVIHSNHENELTTNVNQACNKIRSCNTTLLNQSVLLKDINDSSEQLCALSERLFAFHIMPYYLHLLDKATGTGHFEVSPKKAISLMDQIKKQLPGYLVPKLIREQTGAANKIVIT